MKLRDLFSPMSQESVPLRPPQISPILTSDKHSANGPTTYMMENIINHKSSNDSYNVHHNNDEIILKNCFIHN